MCGYCKASIHAMRVLLRLVSSRSPDLPQATHVPHAVLGSSVSAVHHVVHDGALAQLRARSPQASSYSCRKCAVMGRSGRHCTITK